MTSYVATEPPRLEHVLGDTWCIVTGAARMPLYMPSRDNAVIIDTGLKRPDREGLLALLEQENIRLGAIVTSHFHRDHMGNHRPLQKIYGCPMYYSPLVGALMQDPEVAKRLAFSAGFVILPSVQEIPGVILIYPKKESFTAAGYEFKILDLPGHASEHMGFVTPDNVAYLGDTVLSRDVLHALRMTYCENYALDLQAKRSVLELDYPCYILAHNGVFEDVRELTLENIAYMEQRATFVENLLEEFTCLDALTAKFMELTGGKKNDLRKVEGCRHNLNTVLQYLMGEGRVVARGRDGWLEYGKA